MKIFDCFTFYNEFDILKVRLNELSDTVDYFVLIEADSMKIKSSLKHLRKRSYI
jgi:Glycosyltransferase family 17